MKKSIFLTGALMQRSDGFAAGPGGILLPASAAAGPDTGSYQTVTGPLPEHYATDQSSYLTNISVEAMLNNDDFITPQVFPRLSVQTKWGQIKTWDRGSLLRDEMRLHSYGDRPVTGNYAPAEPVGYHCEHWSLQKDIDPEDLATVTDPLQPDKDATAWLTKQAELNTDRRFMKFFQPGAWGWNYNGVSANPSQAEDSPEFLQFDQAGSRGAAITIAGKINRMAEATGLEPDVLMIGVDVYNFFRLADPDIIGRLGTNGTRIATKQVIAEILGVRKIVVAKNIHNAAREGQPADFQRLFPRRGMLLLHATDNPSLSTPTAGYMTVWERLYSAFKGDKTRVLNQMALIRRGYTDESGVSWVQVHTANGLTVVAPDLGMFFDNVVSATYN